MTYPIKIGELKKGDMIIIDNQPCKILNTKKIKNGKHGKAKAIIEARNYVNNKKVTYSQPASNMVETFKNKRKEFNILSYKRKDDKILISYLDEDNDKEELPLPRYLMEKFNDKSKMIVILDLSDENYIIDVM